MSDKEKRTDQTPLPPDSTRTLFFGNVAAEAGEGQDSEAYRLIDRIREAFASFAQEETDEIPPDQMPSFPGYTILGEVGRGGFGVVYRARDDKLRREVALKVLFPRRRIKRPAAERFLEEARALARIRHPNVLAILLELVPARVCKLISERSSIPIIGLGSGPDAHGQVLIFHDMFGLYPKFTPKMARVYGNAGQVIVEGLKQYVADVGSRDFPSSDNWFTMRDSAFEELQSMLD